MSNKENKVETLDSKKLLKDLARKNTKVKLNQRIKLEITKDNGHYTKGQIIEPHVTWGNALVEKQLAKEI